MSDERESKRLQKIREEVSRGRIKSIYGGTQNTHNTDLNLKRSLHNQFALAKTEGLMNPPPKLRFSTWLIDTFAHGNNTQGLLIVFPFEVSKADEKRDRFEEMIQDAFREIYLA